MASKSVGFTIISILAFVFLIQSCSSVLMVILQIASVDDLESLAQLYEELVGVQTDFCKMRENFKLMDTSPNYVVLTAKEDNLVVGSAMGIICLDLVGKCNHLW